MNKIERVLKRNGESEEFDQEKMYEKLLLAKNGDLKSVSLSEVLIEASRIVGKNVRVVKSRDLQNALIMATKSLIPKDPEYELLAGRLMTQRLRKDVYGSFNPKPFATEVYKRIRRGIYDPLLKKYYDKRELVWFGNRIKYDKDLSFKLVGVEQFVSKYLISKNGKPVETPQEIFMLIPLYVFASEKNLQKRKKFVLEGYRILSDGEISLPTPMMYGIRTKKRSYISCNGLAAGDTKESIANALRAIPLLVAGRSGLGIDLGHERGLGAHIDGGRVTHTGVVPMAQTFDKAKRMFTQEIRHGSATMFQPYFNYDFHDRFIVLKNNKGSEEARARFSDYAAVFNGLFYERAKKGENVTLFHMNEVPDLYDSVGMADFGEKYEKYENSVPVRAKLSVPARKILDRFLVERQETQRIYAFHADHAQRHGNYKVPIRHSNLCMEIVLPSEPMEDKELRYAEVRKEDAEKYADLRRRERPEAKEMVKRFLRPSEISDFDKENFVYFPEELVKETNDYYRGEIFSCILASANMGVLKQERIPTVAKWIVRFLDNVIDMQEYAVPEAEYGAKKRRPLGIGVYNAFYWFAKNGVRYDSREARNLLHEWFETLSYELHLASCELAEERGACDLFEETKFAEGSLLIDKDRYATSVDGLVDVGLKKDWGGLREKIKRHGMRNSSLMAIPPTSNASRMFAGLQGLNPPWSLLIEQSDSKAEIVYHVPEFSRLKRRYVTAFSDDFDNIEYIKTVAVIGKFVDQSISLNLYYDLGRYEGYKIPKKVLVRELLEAYKYGIKSLYYVRMQDPRRGDSEEPEESGCPGGSCEV